MSDPEAFDDDLESDDPRWPWEVIELARKDHRLQKAHSVEEGRALYANRAEPCPRCQAPPGTVELGALRESAETWMGTSGNFTREARSFAEGKPIQLVDGPQLLALIQSVQKQPAAPGRSEDAT
jgi:hypothetical protein